EQALWETAIDIITSTTREERRIRYITPNSPETASQDNEDDLPVRTALASFRPLPALQDDPRKDSKDGVKMTYRNKKSQNNNPRWPEKF
ncbi:hypothetical protein CTQ69_28440, partial [Salmonella enterica subsp. diarizonae]|nr:hypothetical protein [Salmonella enterica subsp. diarizonae]